MAFITSIRPILLWNNFSLFLSNIHGGSYIANLKPKRILSHFILTSSLIEVEVGSLENILLTASNIFDLADKLMVIPGALDFPNIKDKAHVT